MIFIERNKIIMNQIEQDIDTAFDALAKSSLNISFFPKSNKIQAKGLRMRPRLKTDCVPKKRYGKSLTNLNPEAPISKPEKKQLVVFNDLGKSSEISKPLFTIRVFNEGKLISAEEKKCSISSKKSKKSRLSSKLSSHMHSSTPEEVHRQQMQKIRKYINQDNLLNRLSHLSMETSKVSLRIYKEQFQKLFSDRYVKDRITGFLDFQYIEDFDSVLKTINTLLSLQKREVLLLVFIILDQDKDGLITPSDLMELSGLKNTSIDRNILIERDIFRIMQYVKEENDIEIDDKVDDQIFLDETLTITKYRMHIQKKVSKSKLSQYNTNLKLSKRMHSHLFTLHKRKSEDNNAGLPSLDLISNILKMVQIKKELETEDSKKFAINFTRFQKIFAHHLSYTFLDFLYVLGGVKVDQIDYLPLSYSYIFKEILSLRPQKKQEPIGLHKFLKRLQDMKQFKRDMKSEQYSGYRRYLSLYQ